MASLQQAEFGAVGASVDGVGCGRLAAGEAVDVAGVVVALAGARAGTTGAAGLLADTTTAASLGGAGGGAGEDAAVSAAVLRRGSALVAVIAVMVVDLRSASQWLKRSGTSGTRSAIAMSRAESTYHPP